MTAVTSRQPQASDVEKKNRSQFYRNAIIGVMCWEGLSGEQQLFFLQLKGFASV